jgi:hypothetical protein
MEIGNSVKVRGYGGVAFRFDGHPIVHAEEEWSLWCEEDHEHSDYCYDLIVDEEGSEDYSRALCHMIGDDHKFNVPIDDLTPLAREAYCGECGQIGCTHDGLERDEA